MAPSTRDLVRAGRRACPSPRETRPRRRAVEIVAAQSELPGPHRSAEEVAATLAGLSMVLNQDVQLLGDRSAPARGRAAMRHAVGLDVDDE